MQRKATITLVYTFSPNGETRDPLSIAQCDTSTIQHSLSHEFGAYTVHRDSEAQKDTVRIAGSL
jgi:hypothetical protein